MFFSCHADRVIFLFADHMHHGMCYEPLHDQMLRGATCWLVLFAAKFINGCLHSLEIQQLIHLAPVTTNSSVTYKSQAEDFITIVCSHKFYLLVCSIFTFWFSIYPLVMHSALTPEKMNEGMRMRYRHGAPSDKFDIHECPTPVPRYHAESPTQTQRRDHTAI